MNSKKAVVIGIIVVSLGALILSLYRNEKNYFTGNPEIYSKNNMLQALWYHYKLDYIEKDSSRVLDKQRNNVTTSEGQSYAMLRSVWMSDKSTFDATWLFTKNNLQHKKGDHLMSWLFGAKQDGSYGIIIDQGGDHTASDADVDIALSLLFASKRWNDDTYKGDALNIINDIWTKEVVTSRGKNYLAAENLEKFDKKKSYYIINPSYFAPYAYRIFAELDPKHPWLDLVDTSYTVLNSNLDSNLDATSSAMIPSDWIAVQKVTGEITPILADHSLTTDFSFDALRTPWRIELDRQWFDSQDAKDVLSKMTFLREEWKQKGRIATHYTHSGAVITDTETSAMYGGIIGYFMATDKDLAREVYQQKLETLYNPDTFTWRNPLNYYDSNWAWFGIALYNNLLPNLYPVSDSRS